MAENRISILLDVNDQATNRLTAVQSKFKTFSENFKRNWLAITAAITASLYAIQKAFQLIEISAKFKQQEEAFRNFSRSLGVNADSIIKKLREMSGETLNTADIMQNATRAMALGLSPDALPKLMEISRAAARAFGEDVGFMFDSITLGIGRQSRMILDNLGIIVSSETAYKNYADELGKTVEQLTEAEKKQAFLNEVLAQGENIIQRVNIQNKSQLEYLQSLSAFWDDLKVKVGSAILDIIQGVGILVNVLRSGFGEVIIQISNAFAFLTEKIAVATDFYGDLIDKIPGMNDPLEGVTERLENMTNMSRDFSESMRQGTDEFAEAAIQIVDIMQSKVEPSFQRSILRSQELAKENTKATQSIIKNEQTKDNVRKSIENNIVQGFSTIAEKSKAAALIVKAIKMKENIMETASGVSKALGSYPPP
ncbi:MAG: hypothetical protein EOM19_06845, partial [Candidatus Moranbacteria bacterium]|nr:hypothetical protein [Candidatus Moranbacteria bacterium]